MTAFRNFYSMRDDLTGAVKFVGAAVKFCHACFIDIHVVSVQNSQSLS